MYTSDNLSSWQTDISATTALVGVKRHKKRSRWITTVCAGIALCSMTLRASADSHIYLYDGNGTLVDATASCAYQEHYLYDLLGNPIGTVDLSGFIFDSSDQLIGFMEDAPGN